MAEARPILSRLLDLFERSVIVQSLLTVGVIGVELYLYVQGKEVPADLAQVGWALVGFWIGSKVEHEVQHRVRQGDAERVQRESENYGTSD